MPRVRVSVRARLEESLNGRARLSVRRFGARVGEEAFGRERGDLRRDAAHELAVAVGPDAERGEFRRESGKQASARSRGDHVADE